MTEITPTDTFAFEPLFGGWGTRLTCSTTSASARVPGIQAAAGVRIVVSNGGFVSAFIRFGQDDVVADLNCAEILPQTQVVFTLPNLTPNQVYMAGVTEAGTTKIQITAGKGT